jgi:hypothetical protein
MGNWLSSDEVHTVLVREFSGNETEVSVDFNKGAEELFAVVAEKLGKARGSFHLLIHSNQIKDEAGKKSLFDLGFQYRDSIIQLLVRPN